MSVLCTPPMTCTSIFAVPAFPAANVDHAGPGDTWIGLLLSGIVGSTLGAAATILVVVWTIRHEANNRREDALDLAVGNAHAAVVHLQLTTKIAGKNAPETLRSLRSLLQAYQFLLHIARRHEQHLADLLKEAYDQMSAAATQLTDGEDAGEKARLEQAFNDAVQSAADLLSLWLSAPRRISAGKITYKAIKTDGADA